jgi:hypothetical protein
MRNNAIRGSFAAMPAGAAVVAGRNWNGHGWNGHGWHHGHGHRHFVRGFGIGGLGYYGGYGYYDDPVDYSYQGTCSSYYYDENGNTYCADSGVTFNAVGW